MPPKVSLALVSKIAIPAIAILILAVLLHRQKLMKR